MKIVLTGSSGRVGRAIFGALAQEHDVLGIDRQAFATTRIIGDFTNRSLLQTAMEGADAVIHTAAIHAPHVNVLPDTDFVRINTEGTQLLIDVAKALGVPRIVFTSTTALYGDAIADGGCTWVDESTTPEPRTIYHRSKLDAEGALEAAAGADLSVRVLRMSRCFPERADVMALYRLHRGVDVRDVADAHVLGLFNDGPHFQRFIVSGATPFERSDIAALAVDAGAVVERCEPELARSFRRRGWKLPSSIDRVYSAEAAEQSLAWRPRFGFGEVIAQHDRRSIEVLPVGARIANEQE